MTQSTCWIEPTKKIHGTTTTLVYIDKLVRYPGFDHITFKEFLESAINEILYYDITGRRGNVLVHASDTDGIYIDTYKEHNMIDFYSAHPELYEWEGYHMWLEVIDQLKRDLMRQSNDIKYSINKDLKNLDVLISVRYSNIKRIQYCNIQIIFVSLDD